MPTYPSFGVNARRPGLAPVAVTACFERQAPALRLRQAAATVALLKELPFRPFRTSCA